MSTYKLCINHLLYLTRATGRDSGRGEGLGPRGGTRAAGRDSGRGEVLGPGGGTRAAGRDSGRGEGLGPRGGTRAAGRDSGQGEGLGPHVTRSTTLLSFRARKIFDNVSLLVCFRWLGV